VATLAAIRFASRRWMQNNSLVRARRNIAHHYDLDERLYRSSSTPTCNIPALTSNRRRRNWKRRNGPRSVISRPSLRSSPARRSST
jgi:hypothetical protein